MSWEHRAEVTWWTLVTVFLVAVTGLVASAGILFATQIWHDILK